MYLFSEHFRRPCQEFKRKCPDLCIGHFFKIDTVLSFLDKYCSNVFSDICNFHFLIVYIRNKLHILHDIFSDPTTIFVLCTLKNPMATICVRPFSPPWRPRLLHTSNSITLLNSITCMIYVHSTE